MDVYAYGNPSQIVDTKGEVVGMWAPPFYYCDTPECPNFGLLQADLTPNQNEQT